MCLHVCLRCAALKAAVLKVIGECSFSPFPPAQRSYSFSQVGGATAARTVAMADRAAAAAAGVVGGAQSQAAGEHVQCGAEHGAGHSGGRGWKVGGGAVVLTS